MFRGLLFLIFIINIRTSSGVLDVLHNAGNEVWKLYTILGNMSSDDPHDEGSTYRLSDLQLMQQMKKQMVTVYAELYHLEQLIGPKEFREQTKSWLFDPVTFTDIGTFDNLTLRIDALFEQFYQFMVSRNYFDDASASFLEDVALRSETKIINLRELLTSTGTTKSDSSNLIAAIIAYVTKNEAMICDTPHVLSNILIQLLSLTIVAEMKEMTILTYKNFQGYIENRAKLWQEISAADGQKFEEQFAMHIQIFSSHLAGIESVYNRACDPQNGKWMRGVSFHELENTFRTTIFGYNHTNCQLESCSDLMIRKSGQCEPVFSHSPGRAETTDDTGCIYLDRITACALKSGPHRFQYVNSATLGFLGRSLRCPRDNGYQIDTSTNWDSSYVACACNTSDNYNKISLMMLGSTVQSNRVITGLRFVRKDQVLWIQPRTGTLDPNGYINHYAQRWVPLPNEVNSSLIAVINKENRVFFLDDLILPEFFLLTGVKFNKVKRKGVTGFSLEIFGTRFNYRTGKLVLHKDFGRSEQGEKRNSGNRLSFEPVSSVFTRLRHTVTPSDAKYVSLERSRLVDDLGQSTLPFFDAVPVIFRVASPLTGVGIFHKGVPGYAGVISLRVYGMKYEQYFNKFKLFHMDNGRVLFNSSLHESQTLNDQHTE